MALPDWRAGLTRTVLRPSVPWNVPDPWRQAPVAVRRALRRAVRRVRAWLVRSPADVDPRDRIGVATWMVVLGLGISLLLELPSAEISFWALGSPVTIPFTGPLIAAVFLAILAAAGAQSVVTVHPLYVTGATRRRTWTYWALPMALTIIATMLLPAAPSAFLQVVGLLLSGALLGMAYGGLYVTVAPGKPGFRRARLWLDALAYGSALLLFLFVYQTRTRSLVSGTLVAITALLLAIEILRTATDRSMVAITYGGIIGLVLGQVTWALNYWVLPGLTGGLLLLLIFYLMVGIAQQGLLGRLNRRVWVEFAVFGVVALGLIIVMGPGFSIAPPLD